VINFCSNGWLGVALMSTPSQSSRKIHFGEFELNLETAELRGNGSKAILPGQPFHILVTLLGRPGQLVTREELKRQLWPSDTFVDFDVSLNKAVNRLRDALGDSAEHPRFIETLPRKGYRFVGAVGNGTGTGIRNSADLLPATCQPAAADASGQEIKGEMARGRRAHLYGLRHVPVAAMTLVMVAVVVVAISKRFWVPHGPNLASVHITKLTDSGMAQDVAISPDGRFVVYSLNSADKDSLRLRQVATRSEVEILSPGPGFHGLTFSPDGTYVYFVRSDPNNPYFKYLYSVPVLGGPVRRMIADVDSPVTFSPDGSQFAFQRAVVPHNVVELRIANADGSSDHVLATIQNGDPGLFQPGPSWSPDGRTIVCPFRILDKEIRWILASISVPNGAVREIYSDLAAFGRPVWLSEGNLLMPRYDTAHERSQLWTISYPDGKTQRFTNDLTDYDQPLDIARDRKTVVAVASTLISNIWEAPTDNLPGARQITFGELPMINVAETSDGHLFSSGGDGKVWIVKSDGQREAFSDLHDVWWLETCGGLVLFTSFEAKTVTLIRVNGDGSHLLKLFSGDLSYPGCSPDGKFTYYVNRHRPQKVWRISTDGGPPVEIGPGMGTGINGSLDVSPDGKLLSYTFGQYRPHAWKLAILSASGGPIIKLFDVPGGTDRVQWSPAGTSLQYLVTQNGATNIWEQLLAGGKPKQLTNFTSGRIFDFNWSSDQRRLLLTRGDETSDVVLISNLR
jgi:DNA-binding winged helix-turn-helix (wHTH) protein/Tol biopolymer transport system component